MAEFAELDETGGSEMPATSEEDEEEERLDEIAAHNSEELEAQTHLVGMLLGMGGVTTSS